MSDYCMLFCQTFYGLLFSYLTITDVTSYVDHTVHLTKLLLQTVLQMLTKKITLARFACLCFFHSLALSIGLTALLFPPMDRAV